MKREDRKKGSSKEVSLLSGSTGVYRKYRWLETTFLPLSLVLSSRSHSNPPSHQSRPPYSSPRVSNIYERESGKERTARILVINFRPSTSDDIIRRRIDRRLFCHPLSRIWEAGEKGRDGGLVRPFSTGRTTKLLDYPAFYFHEFRRTSARNHNQPCCRPSVAYYGLLSREDNDCDKTWWNGAVLTFNYWRHLRSIPKNVMESAGVHLQNDNIGLNSVKVLSYLTWQSLSFISITHYIKYIIYSQ